MKTFNVFSGPTGASQAVKTGFCWPGPFFCCFWMLAARLWARAALWAALLIAIEVSYDVAFLIFEEDTSETAFVVLSLLAMHLALVISPGTKGNVWRERDLLRRGFELVGTVEARSKREAMALVNQGASA